MKPKTLHRQERNAVSRSVPPSLDPVVPPPIPFNRLELVLLFTILAAGIALRLFAFSHSAVEHFDEGVYASNLYFPPPDYSYPLRRFYAPPLFPGLIETGFVVGLPPNVAALLPSLLAGIGTIIALWWLGRSWFGPSVGLTASALAAFSDFQILFSTAALTDELLGLWLILAVDAIARSLLRGDFRWAVGAGIYTGLAWWTKYNGWLPLAIEAAGIFLLVCISPQQRSRLNSLLACFAVTTVVAVAVWSPYFFSLQSQGGYAPIAANHAKYFVGLAGWLDAASRQLANQRVIATWLSALGTFVAFSLPALLPTQRSHERAGQFISAAILSLAAWICPGLSVSVAVSFIGLMRVAIAAARKAQLKLSPDKASTVQVDEGPLSDTTTIGLALLAAWWLGLFIMTPCYTPYTRLALPFTLVAYLAAPLFAVSPWERNDQPSERPYWQAWTPVALRLALVAAFAGLTMLLPIAKISFERDRRGLLTIAREIRETADTSAPRAIYVYGEPALFFQLRAAGEELIAPVQDIPATAAMVDGKTVPTFFLAGPNTQHDADFQRNWQAASQKWKLIQTYDYRPSPLVWLDLHDPRKEPASASSDAVNLYQLTPVP